MNERELTLFSALSEIGDDLVLESGAFLLGMGGVSVSGGGAEAPVSRMVPHGGGKKPWFLPVTLAACTAAVMVTGILVGVVGNALGFFPSRPPDVTTEEVTAEETVEETVEESVEESVEGWREDDRGDHGRGNRGGDYRSDR